MLLLFLAAHSVFAQENVLTPEDVAKLEYITQATISENGEKIAFRKLVPISPEKENKPAELHLYLYDTKSGQATPFVTGYSVSNIAFRPGHNRISFTAKKEGDTFTSLYEMALDGGEAQKLYSFDASLSSFDWHPDGNTLAFVSHKPEEEKKPDLPYQPEIYEEDLRNSSVYIVNLDNPEPQEVELEGHAVGLKWSPDGDRLAVSAAPTSLVDDFYTSQKISIINADTRQVSAEIDHKGKLGPFQWSPDGSHIAFIAGQDQHDPIDGRLFIARSSGGSPELLHEGFKGKFDGFAWKDNENLFYLASEGVYSRVGTLDLEGEMETLYDQNELSISSFSVADDGRISFVGSSAQHPNELFVMEGDGAPERLTDSNPWLQDEKLGKQEVVTYKAADGLEIQGILIHPVNPSQSNPLITVVHGGPEAHYDNGWLTGYSMPGQMGAGQGFAVFYPNYRGSTGRGAEFAKSSQGDPGGKEFDDIIDGVDYLIAEKNVDKDKVGVTGGSYGGYATAWMATRHTDRFAAGVMSVGISNNLSKWGTSDIPEEMFLVHSRKRIWDDYQFFLERSPIYYADQADTPLLILHGKEDTRVDPGQSYELYRHIKTRTQTPVRLVLYPGEGHGNRKSTARYDFSLRMMRWFNTYLKEASPQMPGSSIDLDSQ